MGMASTLKSRLRETLTAIRRRELFAGFGYAVAVTFALMLTWNLEDLVPDVLESGLESALAEHGKFMILMMAHQLPTVPILTVTVNLLPQAALKRVLVLLGLALVMWGWCTAWRSSPGGAHMSIYGTLGFLVFMNQRTSDRMLEGVRHAELKRVQLDQHSLSHDWRLPRLRSIPPRCSMRSARSSAACRTARQTPRKS
jgi:hypothetical protein